jgi:hypothetical protein
LFSANRKALIIMAAVRAGHAHDLFNNRGMARSYKTEIYFILIDASAGMIRTSTFNQATNIALMIDALI